MSDAVDTLMVAGGSCEARTSRDFNTHNILGVDVWAATCSSAVDEIQRVIDGDDHRKLSFLNAHGANIAFGDADYCETLKQFTVLSDGVGLDLGARMLYGAAFPENLNGTDFIPALLARLEGNRKIALLGARPGVAERAARNFADNHPQHQFHVISDGYFDDADEPAILARLKDERPDILLVAFGNPKQEVWIAENCSEQHAAICVGVGALFDFASGSIDRAPQKMIDWRLEWLYRLWLEPQRMWRRYIVGNPLFLMRILQQKLFGFSNGAKS
ncbi:MAG: WecB/TagA/CpsF family glycosyltransferase [Rhizobiaceae bacterium]